MLHGGQESTDTSLAMFAKAASAASQSTEHPRKCDPPVFSGNCITVIFLTRGICAPASADYTKVFKRGKKRPQVCLAQRTRYAKATVSLSPGPLFPGDRLCCSLRTW